MLGIKSFDLENATQFITAGQMGGDHSGLNLQSRQSCQVSEFQKVPLEMAPGLHSKHVECLDLSDSDALGYFRLVTGWGKCSYKTPLQQGAEFPRAEPKFGQWFPE